MIGSDRHAKQMSLKDKSDYSVIGIVIVAAFLYVHNVVLTLVRRRPTLWTLYKRRNDVCAYRVLFWIITSVYRA